MSEISGEHESETARPIDRGLVVGRLQEYGIAIEPGDFDGLDDDDVMGDIVTYAAMLDIDMDDILREVTPIESRKMDDAAPIATVGDKEE